MEPAEPFYALGHHFAIDLPGARAAFSTRRGGHSAGPYASMNLGLLTDDDRRCVTRNRAALEAELQAPELSFVHQVHGADVRRLTAGTPAPRERVGGIRVDGQATNQRDVALCALTADCLPIALAAGGGGVVAMLHAGWRGLATGMIASGVEAMRELGAEGELSAAIGPGAGALLLRGRRRGPRAFAGIPGGPCRPPSRPQGDRGPSAPRGGGGDRRRYRHLHDLRRPRAAVLPSARPRRHGPPGGRGVVDLIHGLRAEVVARNLERARAAIAAAGRDPAGVEILAAVKYLPAEELSALADGGVTVAGENRAQELAVKAEAVPGRFSWDFIGHLQSRKVKDLLPHVRYIHSVGSASALEQLGRHGGPQTKVLIEVNVAGEAGKSGIAPAALPDFLARCPVTVVGLMTMPPFTADPEDSRPYFAELSRLADRHGLSQLSMGTSQDYVVAAQEGATIVRLGTSLYRDEG